MKEGKLSDTMKLACIHYQTCLSLYYSMGTLIYVYSLTLLFVHLCTCVSCSMTEPVNVTIQRASSGRLRCEVEETG